MQHNSLGQLTIIYSGLIYVLQAVCCCVMLWPGTLVERRWQDAAASTARVWNAVCILRRFACGRWKVTSGGWCWNKKEPQSARPPLVKYQSGLKRSQLRVGRARWCFYWQRVKVWGRGASFCPKTSGHLSNSASRMSGGRGQFISLDPTKGNSCARWRHSLWAAGARHVIRRRMSVKRFLNCLFDLSSQALCLCWTRPRAAP